MRWNEIGKRMFLHSQKMTSIVTKLSEAPTGWKITLDCFCCAIPNENQFLKAFVSNDHYEQSTTKHLRQHSIKTVLTNNQGGFGSKKHYKV